MITRRRPGQVRDAIVHVLERNPKGAAVGEVCEQVTQLIGEAVPASSVRSYLRLNTPELFARTERGQYVLSGFGDVSPIAKVPEVQGAKEQRFSRARLVEADCIDWLAQQPSRSLHAVVTDPPYGLVEYSATEQQKLRAGRGGVWRIPPSFDGAKRSPLPRFTVLKATDLDALDRYFHNWARVLLEVLVPGANVVVASNPLLSHRVSNALARAGLERRGELVRLVMTMRGGDRPKHAHVEFDGVSVMPRSMWEPWLLFRRPLDGRVQDNLRRWGTGGFRRVGEDKQLVRGVLPLGQGVVLDPFAGSGSTLAAAEAVGYESIGVERDPNYFALAADAIPRLAALQVLAADHAR
jgi:site-specific DNA-methyltransferase (adenine-specific)